MKYIRVLTQDDQARTGIIEPDNTINLIDSNIFHDPLPTGKTINLNDVKHYLPPVDPPNIFALGLNYREHARETKADIPQAPLIFIKASTSLNQLDRDFTILIY